MTARAGDIVETTVVADGTYGVAATLSRSDRTGSGASGVGLSRAYGVAIFDAAVSEAEIVVDPTADEVEEALLRLDDALRGQ